MKKSVSFEIQEDDALKTVQFPQLSLSFGRGAELKRSYSVPRTSTPVPPTGLALSESLLEDFDQMDRSSLLDLSNAPPLYEQNEEMEICPSGEKRKSTPPDLLTLSNMYFERNQVQQVRQSNELDYRPGTSTSLNRNIESATNSSSRSSSWSASTSFDYSLDRHNLGLVRPRKLTPLKRLPKSAQIKIDEHAQSQHRPLHLSVNYNGGNVGWKQTLDPIVLTHKKEGNN